MFYALGCQRELSEKEVCNVTLLRSFLTPNCKGIKADIESADFTTHGAFILGFRCENAQINSIDLTSPQHQYNSFRLHVLMTL